MLLYWKKLQNNMCLFLFIYFIRIYLPFYFIKITLLCKLRRLSFGSVCLQPKIIITRKLSFRRVQRKRKRLGTAATPPLFTILVLICKIQQESLVDNTALGSFVYAKWPSILFIPNLPLYFQLGVNVIHRFILECIVVWSTLLFLVHRSKNPIPCEVVNLEIISPYRNYFLIYVSGRFGHIIFHPKAQSLFPLDSSCFLIVRPCSAKER